jgi:DnaJ like chaperone protein
MARQIPGGSSGQGGYNQGGYNRGGYQRTTGGYTATQQRNSFMVSLLVLSSAVIRADGKTLQSELDYVRNFVRSNFGEAATYQAMSILNDLNTKQVNIYEVGAQIASYMNYSQRLQLFDYLARLAAADGDFSASEKSVLEAIASAIRINSSDAASVIAMFYKDASSAYEVLEISPNATDDEVKSAYRRMAMKNHPDKVSTLGPEVQKAAEEKFRKIQEAYETIKKQRGMS